MKNLIAISCVAVSVCCTSSKHLEQDRPIFLSYVCPRPAIEVRSGVWSKADEDLLPLMERRCKELYGSDRCPIKVIKTESGHMVVCKLLK